MSVECDRVGGINLAQGICDTEVPASVADSAIQAIRDGNNTYTRLDDLLPPSGNRSNWLATAASWPIRTPVLVTAEPPEPSTQHASRYSAPATSHPFEPFYGYHVNTLLSVKRNQYRISQLWELDLDTLRTPSRKLALVLNTPSAHLEGVHRTELEAVARLAIEHDLFVFSDEIYEYFLFDDNRHIA